MKLKQYPLDHFTLHPRSARIHRQHNIDFICHSLRQFGQLFPVMSLESGILIKGSGVFLAAKIVHLPKLWTIESDLDADSAEAIMMLDNRITENAEWNMEQVITFLQRLGPQHPLVNCLGWTGDELEILFRSEFTSAIDTEEPRRLSGQEPLFTDESEKEYVWTELYTE